MSLITMAVYMTEENQKDDNLDETLLSLERTVDFTKHRLILSVNGYTTITKHIFKKYERIIEDIIYNDSNIGTAKAVNTGWRKRKPGEGCVKIDDDMKIFSSGWIEEMEAAVEADSQIGQIGLKRMDLWEYPDHPNPDIRSELIMLPHVPGNPWIVVEKAKHIMGSCVLHTSALLDKVGGLFQFGQYGFDDVLMSHRTHLAGFYSCFLPHIKVQHIDNGGTPYQGWKERQAGKYTDAIIRLVHGMYDGSEPIKYPM